MICLLRIGDEVFWRGNWGKNAPKVAKVESIETDCRDDKQGTPVDEVPWSEVYDSDIVIVTMDNEHWAYGYQLTPIEGPDVREKNR